jgi:type VI secretion system protein VasG
MSTELRTLILRLDGDTRAALERAAELCAKHTHFSVDPEHLFMEMLRDPAGEMTRLLKHFHISPERTQEQLQTALDRLKRGNGRTPVLSEYLPPLLEQSWVVASMVLGNQQVNASCVLLAALESDTLRGLLLESAPNLLQIAREALRTQLPALSDASSTSTSASASPERSANASMKTPSSSNTPALDQYTIDLTAQAASGLLDPVYGRDNEVRQIAEVLMRRRQNNPILTGEAGVGKTAVVEGLAQKIARGDVPPALKNIVIRTLDLGLLQAGAGMRGEFEHRLQQVIADVKASLKPIVLFVDEAHQLIGTEGHGDAANLLKPALARGELRTIAATTWSEYKQSIERDPALTRRFQVIKVDEPNEVTAVGMLRGIVGKLEQHHHVHILDAAVRDAVHLSHRYLRSRQLPDKAISILDTACARVAQSQAALPPVMEALRRHIDDTEHQLRLYQRDAQTGEDRAAAIAESESALRSLQAQFATLEQRLQQERQQVAHLNALRVELQRTPGSAAPSDALTALEAQLKALQGEQPLVHDAVNRRVVAEVLSDWTGIPLGRMLDDEQQAVLYLHERLQARIIGQDQALDTIARRVRSYRAGLDDPIKPVGVFLLVGPSGVGKTETACQLADLLYGGQQNMITVNMSEYQEAHSVSGLKGAPPGYVGYGRGGVLTEAIRRQPYSLILLDEMEKAHPDVLELFYQVFDKGTMDDAEGTSIDFRNTLILLTSNAAQEVVVDTCRQQPDASLEAMTAALRPALLRQFPSAFLGRVILVPYRPIADTQLRSIVDIKLSQLAARIRQHHGAHFVWHDAVANAIVARCHEVESGARNIDHIVTQTLLPELASQVLQHIASGLAFNEVVLSLDSRLDFQFALYSKESVR